MARVLVIDNYDSFVYNLVQYLGQLGAEPLVYRNDAIDAATARQLRPDGVLVSPGPGRPDGAGASMALIEEFAGAVPVLGVCLGHQCIGQVFGGQVVRARVMHGKTSVITHDGRGVFAGLPDPLVATRYHSLVVDAGHRAARPRGLRLERGRDRDGPAAPRRWPSRVSSSIRSRSSPTAATACWPTG